MTSTMIFSRPLPRTHKIAYDALTAQWVLTIKGKVRASSTDEAHIRDIAPYQI